MLKATVAHEKLETLLQAQEATEKLSFKSIFGEVSYTPEQVFKFSEGVLGFPEQTLFALVDLPSEKLKGMVLLQSLETPEVAFILCPLFEEGFPYTAEDVAVACDETGSQKESTGFFAIAKFTQKEQEIDGKINLKAPILVDFIKKTGCQYLFEQGNYPLEESLVTFKPQDRETPTGA